MVFNKPTFSNDNACDLISLLTPPTTLNRFGSLDDALAFPNNIAMIKSDEEPLPRQQEDSSTTSTATKEWRTGVVLPFFASPGNKKKQALPLDFAPGPNTVLCGRSRECSESSGNIRFKEIVLSFLKEYQQANDKLEKSFIVSRIVNSIRGDNPVGAFVKLEKGGQWFEVSDRCAREKVGALFRDLLHTDYKSSAKNKSARRKHSVNSTDARRRSSDQSVASYMSEASSNVSMADAVERRSSSMASLPSVSLQDSVASLPTASSNVAQQPPSKWEHVARVSLHESASSSAFLEASHGSSFASFYDVEDLQPVDLNREESS